MKRIFLAGFIVFAMGFCQSAWSTTYTDLLGPTYLGPPVGNATNGTSLTINDGSTDAIFTVAPVNYGAGTGNFNSFLRFENPNANRLYEQAYNTDDRSFKQNQTYSDPANPGGKAQFDALDDPNWTRSVTLGQLPRVTFAGVEYFELLFDINEPQDGISPLISMLELELYVNTSSGSANDYYGAGWSIAGGDYVDSIPLGTKIWELDFGTNDNTIELDSSILGSGSGKYDLVVLFETSLLDPFDDDDFFYLYNELGNADASVPIPRGTYPYPAQAGFEEWAYIDYFSDDGGGGGGNPVPEPSTLVLLGAGLIGLVAYRRKRH